MRADLFGGKMYKMPYRCLLTLKYTVMMVKYTP